MFEILNKKIGRKNKKGFTLIELIVVIAIIAVLAAVGIPTMTGLVKDSKEKAAVADAKTIAMAAQTLATEHDIDNTKPVPDFTNSVARAGLNIGNYNTTGSSVDLDATNPNIVAKVTVKMSDAKGGATGIWTR